MGSHVPEVSVSHVGNQMITGLTLEWEATATDNRVGSKDDVDNDSTAKKTATGNITRNYHTFH